MKVPQDLHGTRRGKQTATLAGLAINAPRTPALKAAISWLKKLLRPSPSAMDEEASWRRLGAQVLWYRRDNLASNLKLLAVTQLVRNRTRAA